MPRNVKVSVAFLGVMVLGVALFWVTTQRMSVQRGTDWPPLTMTYEVTYMGDRGQRITQGYRHEYQDKYQWRNILLSDSEGPTFVGTSSEYNGEKSNTVELLTNIFNPNTDVSPSSVQVPNEWLHPFYIPKLLAQSNSVSTINGDIGTLVVTATRPCSTPTVGMQAAGLGDCQSERVETTEVTYRTADFIPLLIVESWDGVELRRITTINLTVNGIPQPVVE